jgi:spore maturation protein CgeB
LKRRLLIVGDPNAGTVGYFLMRAALSLKIDAAIVSTNLLNSHWSLIDRLYWHLADRRFPNATKLNLELCEIAKEFQPTIVLVTGCVPIFHKTFKYLQQMHTAKIINYSTDDPWNRATTRNHFIQSLKFYDAVATPRRHTIPDFESAGVRHVRYVPFGYSEFDHIKFSGPESELRQYQCEVLVYGGADKDRTPIVRRLLADGFNIHLYGGYWNRYSDLAPHYRGFLNAYELPKAIRAAQVVLGLVRRSNRDSNCMRTYEVPAMGGCLLPEDTEDQRILFSGSPSAVFFSGEGDVSSAVRRLLSDPARRQEFRNYQNSRIISGDNSYSSRLLEMIDAAEGIEQPTSSIVA